MATRFPEYGPDASPIASPGLPTSEIDLFDRNGIAFLVMNESSEIDRKRVNERYGIIRLGTINDLVGLDREEYIFFIFDRERIDVARRIYRDNESYARIKRDVIELINSGYSFLPAGLPTDPNISDKIVAFRVKPTPSI